MMKKILLTLLFAWILTYAAKSQLIPDPYINPQLTTGQWDASWISVPGASAFDYGVYFFRNSFTLTQVPDTFTIHISADNRYKLYVNGTWIGLGPARSDADNWVFDTYDIAAYLAAGTNVVAAEVWNFGRYKPRGQVSLFTGLIVQGDDAAASALNTPGNWRSYKSAAYSPIDPNNDAPESTFAAGPGDRIDGNTYPWGWKDAGYNPSGWQLPVAGFRGAPKGAGTEITHALVPRTIPAMELTPIEGPVLRKQDQQVIPSSGVQPFRNYTIPANTRRTLLLDQGELVTAYPELVLSEGKNASLRLTYAEALFDDAGRKQHRDTIRGRSVRGYADEVISNGEDGRKYTTLWFRTFRYIQLDIETGDEPLMIQSITPVFTAYPFVENAWFRSDRQDLSALWEAGWRTSRLCANEVYFNDPYSEQLQYVGDARIQALVSLYVSGDDRLMRKTINDFYHSVIPEGLTQGRYPSEPRQVIPTYSLFWVSMIHDYLWHRNDYYFAAAYLVTIQHILQWFENRIDGTTGMLGPMPYRPFVDHTAEWSDGHEHGSAGVPPGAKEGQSSILSLQFAMTLDQAADIFSFFGFEALAAEYTAMADGLVEAVKKHCWDEERGLFADTPAKKSFSQHANTFAVLTNAVSKPDQALFMEQVTRDTTLVQASLYFRHYINQAVIHAGLGNKYLSLVAPWQHMPVQGLSTLSELSDTERTRSDCRASSSGPLYELLATVAGMRPAGPGFESVIIAPHPGSLKWIKAGMPHYYGEIGLDLEFGKDGSVGGTIALPPGLKGVFVWDHQTVDLQPGKQRVALQPLGAKFKIDPH